MFPVAGEDGGKWGMSRVWAGATFTFVFVTLGWVLFRAPSLAAAGEIFSSMLFLKGGLQRAILRENAILVVLVMFIGLIAAQTYARMRSRFEGIKACLAPVRRVLKPFAYAGQILAVIIFDKSAKAFVYFQF
jgi:hypothetical protein